ncbi:MULTISPECIES: metal-dependent hydrolase [Oceanospirillaceae]|jgi:predicted metal-dependent hydrolase|uniref:metal-dependent hydrolase n=1 Tax=Oceanospirillaceae TaxID=135620 RepID=UPI001190C6EF|nr:MULTISPECIES: metal-dependent hydrolase [Thalassolituus]MCB2387095.1 metal-dependent hydrolase [Thalassolituus alkanivorans]MCB2421459.1 metal-dependent hydrolase [Thalassolituus alkanivorans]TVV44636.1 metal-dependent hydrolase [Thalassolituus sp. C2-1]
MNSKLQKAQAISSSMEIPGRKMEFEFDLDDIPKYWYGDDVFKSTFMNALSCLFPEGERMFMDAVRDNQHKISDPQLLQQIKGFIKQEAIHGHEHAQYNDYLKKWNYPIDKIMAFEKKEKVWMKKWLPRKHRLAVTCALEHFTAIMAHQVLTNPESTEGMHPQFKEMWRWHAIEETEHKAVAYDVYQQAVGSYWLRVLTMINVTILFCLRTSIIQAIFLWKDGQLFNPKVWWKGFRFYFLKPGLVPTIWRDYLDYFRRDFHPWMHDNRELLGEWEAEQQKYKTV